MRTTAATIKTPHTTPTTIPAIAPPLMPLFLFDVLFPSVEESVEVLAPPEVELASEDEGLTTEVVVTNTVCACWSEPVETDAVTRRVV